MKKEVLYGEGRAFGYGKQRGLVIKSCGKKNRYVLNIEICIYRCIDIEFWTTKKPTETSWVTSSVGFFSRREAIEWKKPTTEGPLLRR